MITRKQILSAEGEELDRLLGEVLQNRCCLSCVNCTEKPHGCFSCLSNVSVKSPKGWITRPNEHCCLDFGANEISLNWDNAMKWRDWAGDNYGGCEFVKGLLATLGVAWEPAEIDFTAVCGIFAMRIDPEHYLKAAALCKIGAKT